MTYIQYTQDGNNLTIDYTNQFRDILVSAQCWPKKGFHAGCYKAAQWLMDQEQFDKTQVVTIKGISMGGAIGEVLGSLLQTKGYSVIVIAKGSYPVTLKKITLPGLVIINGNDPIPALFPWFKHTVEKVFTGDKRTIPISWGGHCHYSNN